MSPVLAVVLVALNLGLIFLFFALPLGVRTVRMSRLIAADRERVWSALWPFGDNAAWSGQQLSGERMDDPGLARVRLGWDGRDNRPIERILRLEDVVEGERFSARVVDDSSLDASFFADYRETAELSAEAGKTRVTLTRTDRYRGGAFLLFRYFALRRELGKLKLWAETGKFRAGGMFEHPASQVGFAILSVLIMWPVFGLNIGGLVLAMVLTIVVALHELGHMAAFRVMGHRKVRMIFIPLLGGIAIGGRPYDSRFEVAFVVADGRRLLRIPRAAGDCRLQLFGRRGLAVHGERVRDACRHRRAVQRRQSGAGLEVRRRPGAAPDLSRPGRRSRLRPSCCLSAFLALWATRPAFRRRCWSARARSSPSSA